MKVLDFLNQNKWIHDNLLEIGFDGIFNNLLLLTCKVCESSFSQINIIGQKKHWRNKSLGVFAEPYDQTEVLHELVLNHNQFFEIEDLFKEDRLFKKKLLIDDRVIRYYSAVPLFLSDGSLIGTISIMDSKSRCLNDEQKSFLSLLAKDAVSQIELHLKNFELEKKLIQYADESKMPTQLLNPNDNAYDELDDFLHLAVHDLKAPLNAIKNVASWVEEDLASGTTEDNDKHFFMIKNSVKRMHQLLTDLRIYSQTGREITPPENINLKVLVDDCCELIESSNHFDINVESCQLELPKKSLLLVLNNLLSNAIKHHDKEKGTIKVCCVSEEAHYKLSVTDDGPGIPTVFQQKIFDAFQKLKSKDEVEGNGLGLAMIRKTLTPYSAEINVHSQEGKGTTFTVVWPKNNVT